MVGAAARAHPVSPPRWRDERVLAAMHAALCAEHGLGPGRADPGLLAAALAEPRRMMTAGVADPLRLAVAYCAGLARARPFAAGSAALALAALYATLRLGGLRLSAPEAEAVAVIRDLAGGGIGMAELAAWVRRGAVPA